MKDTDLFAADPRAEFIDIVMRCYRTRKISADLVFDLANISPPPGSQLFLTPEEFEEITRLKFSDYILGSGTMWVSK